MKSKWWCGLFLTAILFLNAENSFAQQTPLDPKLRLGADDEVSPVFEGVVAVQRKAKVKAGSFLINPMFSYDFSDAPYTQRSLQLNFGYAFGESFELYLAYSPFFMADERNLSKQIRQIPPAGTYSIEAEKPKSFMGVEANWVPIYGKDSWGPYNIVRSDTFINFSYGQIKYERNNGNKIKLALGKTFFFSDYFNLRVQAGPSFVETFSKEPQGTEVKKENITIGLIESGLVFYF